MEERVPGRALRPCLFPTQEREKYPEPLGSLVLGQGEWEGSSFPHCNPLGTSRSQSIREAGA